jgi:hypothetical protein
MVASESLATRIMLISQEGPVDIELVHTIIFIKISLCKDLI